MYQCTKWDLSDLLKSPKDGDKVLKEIEKLVKKVESYKKKLKPSISEKDFFAIVKILEKIRELIRVVSSYGGLWFEADTKSQEAKAFETKVDDFLTPISNRLLFFSLWWKDLDNKNALRLIKNAGKYKYYLETIRKFKPFTLSEPEEKIINIKDSTGANSLAELYGMLKAGFKYKFKDKEITENELIANVHNKDPKIREQVYNLLLNKYKSYDNEFGYVYQTIVRDFRNEAILLRGHKRPLSVRNFANDIPDQVTDALLKVCQKNAKVFQRYFKLKAKLIGLKKLRRYDVYAPVGAEANKYSFDQAVKLTLDSYNKFNPEMTTLIKRVIDEKHLDSEIRVGKKPGAFCASVRSTDVPYVLMNFTGTAREVATLAHELGHAVHAMLASKHPVFTFHSSLPMAETASTFGEMLLSEHLIEEVDNKGKIQLLVSKLDDIYATIGRQSFFTLFEKDAHDLIAKGCKTSDLCDIYYKNLQEQFGDSVILSEDFKYEWLYIPHMFFTPFYCYAYAFGNLLVLALYEMYKKQGKSFVPKYIRMLSHGGSKPPVEILKEIGVDPASEKFWQQGFDFISGMVDELEDLVG